MAALADTTVDLEERHVPATAEADPAWLNYASLGPRRPGAPVLSLRPGAVTWLSTVYGVSGAW
jgi:hypothetical protein